MNFSIGMPLGDKLRLIRKEEGLSQDIFGEIVGLSRSTLANIESGRNRSVGVDTLAKIASHSRFAKYAIWLLVDELTDDQAQQALDFVRELKASEQQNDAD